MGPKKFNYNGISVERRDSKSVRATLPGGETYVVELRGGTHIALDTKQRDMSDVLRAVAEFCHGESEA